LEEHVKFVAASEPHISFQRVALARNDGPLRLFRAADPASDSLSAVNLLGGTETLEVPGRSLTSLMAENGHQRIHLLKLDIEGAKYDVLESLDLAACGVRVLCVELHHTVSVGRARRLMERLSDQGFTLVSRSRADFTFLRTQPARARSRAGTTGRRAGAAAVGSLASASLWCGSLTGVLCTMT
jgi:FkbM family methyltransferase